ncbi:MAG: methyltransferase domain-containing protein [Promethearchaeota archaeon]
MNNDLNLYKKIEKILQCPKTGKKMEFDESNRCFHVLDDKLTYPIVEDIIELLPEKLEENTDYYTSFADTYEYQITNPSSNHEEIWGFHNDEIKQLTIDYIPTDFDGILLDIPVGTGIQTFEKYQTLPNATIIVVDYSIKMITQAKKRYRESNIKNIIYIQADVGKLPFFYQTIDLLFTQNGIHAFPDKEKSIDEMARVLKQHGQLSGCFYVKGEREAADRAVDDFYTKIGAFRPPYFTKEESIRKFSKYFKFIKTGNLKSIFHFNAIKS